MHLLATRLFGFALACLLCAAPLHAQQTAPPTVTEVPRLIRITGSFRPANGLPPAPVEIVTLAIYAEETGGTPLWQETQNVAIDAKGGYTIVLGPVLTDNAGSLGNSRIFQSGSRLGVGTTTPSDYMHVAFNDAGGAFTGYAVQNLSGSATRTPGRCFTTRTERWGSSRASTTRRTSTVSTISRRVVPSTS
jgi:hypothetical protein